MPAALDVVQLLYGGAGGQRSVARTLDEGFRRSGLRTGVVLHARPGQLASDTTAWAATDLVWDLPRHGPFDVTLGWRLGRILAQHQARALLVHIPYAARAVHRARGRGDLQAAVLIEHHSLARRRRRDDLRSALMLRAASAVVMLTEQYRAGYPLMAHLERRGVPVVVIGNGVDVRRHSPRGRTGSEEADGPLSLRVGMAGGFTEGKDQATLIRAAAAVQASVPGIEVVLMGDGPNRSALESLAADLGVAEAVHLNGHLTTERLADELQMLDVYVHCSKGETQSVAILQAQATGLPVVASRAAGVTEAVADGRDGLLVPAGSVEGVASALVELARDPRRRRALGEAGRSRVLQQATEEIMVGAYLDLLARVDEDGPWREAGARLGT